MPPHAVLGVAAITVACIAGVLGLIYVAAIGSRLALRWPLVVASALAFACSVVAGEAAKPLLEAVEATGSTGEIAAAQAHAHGSDILTLAVFALSIAVLATVWSVLRPARGTWSVRMSIGGGIVAIASCATIATAAIVLVEALNAVAVGHPSWGSP